MEYQYAYQPQPVYVPQYPCAPQPAYTPVYACPPQPVAQNPFANWEYPCPSQSACQPQPVYVPQPAAQAPITDLDLTVFGWDSALDEGLPAPQPAYAPQHALAPKPITALDLDSTPVDDGPSFKLPAMEFEPAQPVITDKQLRALSRKHLFIMIRDQQRELRQARERESLLRDFHAWLPQARQPYGV